MSTMVRAATLSACSRYRYSLRRTWQEGTRVLCFIMLNPSTADADIDDPTIRRCIGFGKAWKYDALEVVNLFAWRETHPSKLQHVADPIGPENNDALKQAADRSSLIVCAWGANDLAVDRVTQVSAILSTHLLFCVGRTKGGAPKHPLYVPHMLWPVIWRGVLV